MAAAASKPATQSKTKSAPTNFNSYIQNHSKVIIEASIKLSGATPVQEFIVNLQELLKNGQLVDRMFAFCPINLDGKDKTTNMTMLVTHFKISSNGKNPFEKQKQWGKVKKDKEEFCDLIVYFSLAISNSQGHGTRESSLKNIHKWQRRGGVLL